MRRGAVALLVILLTGCGVADTELEGRPCRNAFDCAAHQACVVEEGNRLCRAYRRPPTLDGGRAVAADGGDVPAYCDAAKPVLDRYCTPCHGADEAVRADPTFRLDYYVRDGGLPGAQAKAARIKERAADFQDMPPFDHPEQPTVEERVLLARWVDAGAPFCFPGRDAGSGAGDGGG